MFRYATDTDRIGFAVVSDTTKLLAAAHGQFVAGIDVHGVVNQHSSDHHNSGDNTRSSHVVQPLLCVFLQFYIVQSSVLVLGQD